MVKQWALLNTTAQKKILQPDSDWNIEVTKLNPTGIYTDTDVHIYKGGTRQIGTNRFFSRVRGCRPGGEEVCVQHGYIGPSGLKMPMSTSYCLQCCLRSAIVVRNQAGGYIPNTQATSITS